MPSTTTELLVRARAGTEPERGALLERYRSYLELLARVALGRRLRRKVDTADVVQETFLEAHRNFHRFRGVSEPEFIGWLREILAALLHYQHIVAVHAVGCERDVHFYAMQLITQSMLNDRELSGGMGKLNLSNTEISDKGLEQITKMLFLGDLDVTGTKVTDAGVKAFLKARAENPDAKIKKPKVRR